MKSLTHPLWIFIINTLAFVILFLLFFDNYTIVKTLLNEDDIATWQPFILSGTSLFALSFLYGLFSFLKKQELKKAYGFITLISYTVFLYFFIRNTNELNIWHIPRWMLSPDLQLYVYTFIMPTIVHALFILVTAFTPSDSNHKPWKNFITALSIPLFWYLFFQLILPAIHISYSNKVLEHIGVILFVISTILFLFFLMRGVLLLFQTKSEWLKKNSLIWKIPFAILFPIAGLMLNNGVWENNMASGNYIFGDFTDPFFYIIAFLNGVLFCLPEFDNIQKRMILFLFRSITLSFSFYFFIVFLPFLPLSVAAVLFIGVGFLMLTPLILFILHIASLYHDFQFLRIKYPSLFLIAILAFGFLILPALVTVNYFGQKQHLSRVLSYTFKNESYNKQSDHNISLSNVQKLIYVLKKHKSNHTDFGYSQTPYLSSLYNSIVLNNLTLPNRKIEKINYVFNNSKRYSTNRRGSISQLPILDSINYQTHFMPSQNAWKTDVKLFIQNDDVNFSEYNTVFDIPEDAFITDYYLMIENEKVPGILAERKAANWVYNQIVNTKRDPGFLRYNKFGQIELNVFPFSKNQLRETGFSVIHKQNLTLNIDDLTIDFLDTLNNTNEIPLLSKDQTVAYISAKAKKSLQPTERKPYLHFIVDMSEDAKKEKKTIEEQMLKTANMLRLSLDSARISLTDAFVSEFSYQQGLEVFDKHKSKGGFFLERAMKRILIDEYQTPSKAYPILIVLSNNINSFQEESLTGFEIALPELPYFVSISGKNEYLIHKIASRNHYPFTKLDSLKNTKVYQFEFPDKTTRYLSSNNTSEFHITKDFQYIEQNIQLKHWNSALTLKGLGLKSRFFAENSNKHWLSQVKASFLSQFLNQETAYLSLENDAQREMLLKKQKETLSSDVVADLTDETIRMSEPSFYIFIFLMLILLSKKKLRQLFSTMNQK